MHVLWRVYLSEALVYDSLSIPRLRESSDRSLGLKYAPCMCLGEVHAP